MTAAERSPLQAARRRTMLGLAHKAAAAFGWDDAFRREQQQRYGGCASCADMSDDQLERWLWKLKDMGADIGVPRAPQGAAPRGAAARPDDARAPLLRKLRAQCAAGGWPWPAYVLGASRRMWGEAAPAELAWHSPKQLMALVAALAYQAKRESKRADADAGAGAPEGST